MTKPNQYAIGRTPLRLLPKDSKRSGYTHYEVLIQREQFLRLGRENQAPTGNTCSIYMGFKLDIISKHRSSGRTFVVIPTDELRGMFAPDDTSPASTMYVELTEDEAKLELILIELRIRRKDGFKRGIDWPLFTHTDSIRAVKILANEEKGRYHPDEYVVDTQGIGYLLSKKGELDLIIIDSRVDAETWKAPFPPRIDASKSSSNSIVTLLFKHFHNHDPSPKNCAENGDVLVRRRLDIARRVMVPGYRYHRIVERNYPEKGLIFPTFDKDGIVGVRTLNKQEHYSFLDKLDDRLSTIDEKSDISAPQDEPRDQPQETGRIVSTVLSTHGNTASEVSPTSDSDDGAYYSKPVSPISPFSYPDEANHFSKVSTPIPETGERSYFSVSDDEEPEQPRTSREPYWNNNPRPMSIIPPQREELRIPPRHKRRGTFA